MKISVRLQGGLGNQLFQLAAGFVTAKKMYQDSLTLDASRIPFGTDSSRRLQISNLRLIPDEIELKFSGKTLHNLSSIVPSHRLASLISMSIASAREKFFLGKGEFIHEFKDFDSMANSSTNLILNGYFIDFSIADLAESLGFRNNLELLHEESCWLKEQLHTIEFSETIAIHLRLGDYLRFPQIFGNVSDDFYFEGLTQLGYKKKNRILIFSDQPNRVANTIPRIANLENVEIVRHPINVSSTEIMLFMSKFERIICANSTFSMWAAWFNDDVQNREKGVVIPTPYLLNGDDIITPESWIKLPRELPA